MQTACVLFDFKDFLEPQRIGVERHRRVRGQDDVTLDADLSKSTMSMVFGKAHKDRSFEMGIQEANMLGTAAGLALAGYTPFCSNSWRACRSRTAIAAALLSASRTRHRRVGCRADRADYDSCVRLVRQTRPHRYISASPSYRVPPPPRKRSRFATICCASRRETAVALTTHSTWCRRLVSHASREKTVMWNRQRNRRYCETMT